MAATVDAATLAHLANALAALTAALTPQAPVQTASGVHAGTGGVESKEGSGEKQVEGVAVALPKAAEVGGKSVGSTAGVGGARIDGKVSSGSLLGVVGQVVGDGVSSSGAGGAEIGSGDLLDTTGRVVGGFAPSSDAGGAEVSSSGGVSTDSYAAAARKPASVSGTESTLSWADAVEEEEDQKKRGESVDQWVAAPAASAGKGFFAQHVRTAKFLELTNELFKYSGHKLPKNGRVDLALASYTAATVPDAFEDGRSKLRALALIGDAAIAAAVVSAGYKAGEPLAVLQQRKTNELTDANMAKLFACSRLASFVSVAGAVTLDNSKTGATALEAFAGVLSLHCGNAAVRNYVVNMGLMRRRI